MKNAKTPGTGNQKVTAVSTFNGIITSKGLQMLLALLDEVNTKLDERKLDFTYDWNIRKKSHSITPKDGGFLVDFGRWPITGNALTLSSVEERLDYDKQFLELMVKYQQTKTV